GQCPRRGSPPEGEGPPRRARGRDLGARGGRRGRPHHGAAGRPRPRGLPDGGLRPQAVVPGSEAASVAVTKAEAKSRKKEPELFLNRELSWLEFNGRVLEEAMDPTTPLLDR